MTPDENQKKQKGCVSSLKLRRQRNLLCSLLIIVCVLSCSQTSLAEKSLPDTVPEWFPVETCLEMMRIMIDTYGLSPEGAASVLGNVCQESKFKPSANSGYYIGICQWDPYDRWPLIVDWIIKNNFSTDSAIAQLEAIFNDAENGRYLDTIEYMKTVTQIEDGVWRWLNYYEGAPGQQEAERVSYAYIALELYNANY